jgi:hypothetical protein
MFLDAVSCPVCFSARPAKLALALLLDRGNRDRNDSSAAPLKPCREFED